MGARWRAGQRTVHVRFRTLGSHALEMPLGARPLHSLTNRACPVERTLTKIFSGRGIRDTGSRRRILTPSGPVAVRLAVIAFQDSDGSTSNSQTPNFGLKFRQLRLRASSQPIPQQWTGVCRLPRVGRSSRHAIGGGSAADSADDSDASARLPHGPSGTPWPLHIRIKP